MKKGRVLWIELFLSFFVITLFLSLYLIKNEFLENLNTRILDSFYTLRGDVTPSGNIVIVDIDEKSLKSLGQWPWSRNKFARVLQNLTKNGVGIIGLDIVFAEEDNSSPKKVFEKLGLKGKNVADYDEILAKTFASSPLIAGYMFDFKEDIKRGIIPNIPVVIVQKGYKTKEFLPEAKGIVTNIPILQKSAYSSGFFNTFPDSDGIVRSVPLLVKYKDGIYPSLSLEILRAVYGADKVIVDYNDVGISSISLGEKEIQTDRFARLRVNYYGISKLFRYISAVDIYNENFKKEDIEGKIVLVGTSAGGLLDLRATPLESTYAGVEIHATAIENILNSEYILNPEWIEIVDLFDITFLSLLITLLLIRFGAVKSFFSLLVILFSFLYAGYFFYIYEHITLDIIYPLLSLIVLYILLTSLHYFFETKQKELIKNKFAKKVSKAVAESLIRQGDKEILEAKEQDITIFFSDIRGFTSISEEIANPKKLIEFLNIYMTPMTEIITENRGTVDKFIGDAIMAYWNAPLRVENHADKAVCSAIEQIKSLENVNMKLKDLGYPKIDIGCGINSGLAVVGEMGSEGRSDYTVIGDSVNLASRLEGLCKVYGAKIIISEFTKEMLTGEYEIRELDTVRVKGKNKPVGIYEISALKSFDNEDFLRYNKALSLYRNSDFETALNIFLELYTQNRNSKLYKLYIDRCEYYIKTPPIDFDGVFEFKTK